MHRKYVLEDMEKEAAVICGDFTVFCDYITENNVKLAKKTGNIGKKDCFTLNTFFHVRKEYEKPTYFQNQYPIIDFFYYTAVKYKILEMNSAGAELQKGRNYQCFSEASLWEQYMLFLTVFLFDGMFAGREDSWYTDRVADMWQIYVDSFMEWVDTEKPGTGCRCRISGKSRIDYFSSLDLITPYMEELSLIKVWKRPDGGKWDRGNCWEIEAQPLLKLISDLYENTDIEEDADTDTMVHCAYEAFMKKLMRKKQQGGLLKLFEDSAAQNREQIIDLEVSVRYTDCIRIIRMNLKQSLYDLHRMIQEAVSFDDDHLFEFSVGSGMMKRTYVLSECMNSARELPVEETNLSDLELCRGQRFTYLFDFGDMWWFDIKVLEIREGAVEAPGVIKAVNDAPRQYPDYEEEMEGWDVEISDQVQISDILASIEDELIREEYAALTGVKDGSPKESPAIMRQDMERILLQNPDKMLTFITSEMREMLSELLQCEWIDGIEKCTLAKLYSFGFCRLPEEDQYVVLVPAAVKGIYLSKIKTAKKKDKIVEAAEVFLGRCGVMEMRLLHSAVAAFLKSRISYEEFEYLIYSRLHYFGAYFCDCYDQTEYISCYDRKMTRRILAERLKPENAEFDYPDFIKIYSGKPKEIPKALEDWNEYIKWNMSIDWQTAEKLIAQIPAMAVSGIYEKEEILAVYKEMLHGTGCRVTKKAEGLIDKLCSTMPLATKKGNIGMEDCAAEKGDPYGTEKAGKTEVKSDGAEKNLIQEEYTQLSIFDL